MIGVGCFLSSALHQLQKLANGFHAYFLTSWGIARTNLKDYGTWAGVKYMHVVMEIEVILKFFTQLSLELPME